MANKKCVCEIHDLEEGDTLYVFTSWDGGVGYEYIHDIKYCPVCGKKLSSGGQEGEVVI